MGIEQNFYPDADHKPKYLGKCSLAKRSPIVCEAYVYKQGDRMS